MVCTACRCCVSFSHHLHIVSKDVSTINQPQEALETHTSSTALCAPAVRIASAAASTAAAATPQTVNTQLLLLLLLLHPHQPLPHRVCQQYSPLCQGHHWQQQTAQPRKPVAWQWLCPGHCCLLAGLWHCCLGVTACGGCWECQWQMM